MDTTTARKYVDCSKFPSDINCTLYISGKPDEVLKAAVEHAVSTHGHQDTPELREQLVTMMVDET
jgi:predicted small metal-binding protein